MVNLEKNYDHHLQFTPPTLCCLYYIAQQFWGETPMVFLWGMNIPPSVWWTKLLPAEQWCSLPSLGSLTWIQTSWGLATPLLFGVKILQLRPCPTQASFWPEGRKSHVVLISPKLQTQPSLEFQVILGSLEMDLPANSSSHVTFPSVFRTIHKTGPWVKSNKRRLRGDRFRTMAQCKRAHLIPQLAFFL